jgi:hypothetical protein
MPKKAKKVHRGGCKWLLGQFSVIYGANCFAGIGVKTKKKGCYLEISAIFGNIFLCGFRQNRAYFRFCGMGGPVFQYGEPAPN